jgi:hypothetical protein
LAKLPKAQAFRFFRELVNYDEAVIDAATLRYDTHVDYFVSDSAVECHRDHLQVGRRHVKVLSMKEPPAQTFADLLRDFHAIPGEFIACLEWQRISSDKMRRELQTRRRHFFNKRVSIVNYVTPEARPEEMLVDDSAGATVRQLGDALTELEVTGISSAAHRSPSSYTGRIRVRFSTTQPKCRRRWLSTTAACSRRRTTC